MARPKVKLIGRIRHSESKGLQFSVPIEGESKTLWVEVLPNALAMNWPGITKTKDYEANLQAMHADSNYQAAAKQYM